MENDAVKGKDYKVLARRWRPQQFGQLVGQDSIGKALQGAITAGRVAHAYLFTGARGVGKTSTARILAKALNCVNGPTCDPCDECDICQGVVSGDDIDVIEIDGASNRGIDEVRDLRQNISLRPTRARYKIYIIDEVHMLTREAFNALLKTLEEPPDHVKFVFATTDPQKIPITILSRCQRFDFRGINNDRLRNRLLEIVHAENVEFEEAAMDILIRRAGGSMRDAQSLLDQLLAFGAEKITADDVHFLLGTASEDRLLDLMDALISRKPGAAIQILDSAEQEGVQLGQLLDQLMEYYRDLMVVHSAGDDVPLRSVSQRHRDTVKQQSESLSLQTMLASADILSETKSRLRATEHGRVLVDIAMIRVANLEDLVSIDELIDRIGQLETGDAISVPARSRVDSAPPPRSSAPEARPRSESAPAQSPVKKKAVGNPPDQSESANVLADTSPAVAVAEPPQPELERVVDQEVTTPIPLTLTLPQAEERIRVAAREMSPWLAESVSRSKLEQDKDAVVVLVDAMYNTPAQVAKLEEELRVRIPGLNLRVEVTKKHAESDVQRGPSYSEKMSDAAKVPLVKRAIELWEARVIRVDD